MKNGKFEAGDIYALLYKRHSEPREWLCAREVSDQTGWSHRRLDFVACNCYASKGQGVYAFEVKISKSDLRNELFDPTKHNIFFDNIDFFSIVAPDYVLDAEYIALIPKNWGIVKAVAGKSEGEPNKLVTVRKPLALHDEKSRTMSKEFVMAMLRRLRDDPSNKGTEAEMRLAQYQKGYEDGKRWCARTDYEKLWKEAQEKCRIYADALHALGVHPYWCKNEKEIVEDAKERSVEIKKYEELYRTASVLGNIMDGLRTQVGLLASCLEPLQKAKEEADNLKFNTETTEGLEQAEASVKAATVPFTEAAEAVENVEAEPKAEVLDF